MSESASIPRSGHASVRDVRIDLFRGFALAMIFVNHIHGNPLSFFTLRSWGLSDSAEVFVFLAGISAALAYGRAFDRGEAWGGVRQISSRILRLYIIHLALFFGVALLCLAHVFLWQETSYVESLGFDSLLEGPRAFLADVLRLTFQPGYLDILPMYIVLLASLPVLFLFARLHWSVPLGAALVLYVASWTLGLNLPNVRTGFSWFFNPFAWQLIFVIGFTTGRAMADTKGLSLPEGRWRKTITTLALVYVVAGVIAVAPWTQIPRYEHMTLIHPDLLGSISKTNLHPARLLNTLAQAWLVAVFIDSSAAWLRNRALHPFMLMGKHSLEVFAVSILCSVAGGSLATVEGFTVFVTFFANSIGLALMIATAYAMEARRSRAKSKATPTTTIATPISEPRAQINSGALTSGEFTYRDLARG